LLQSQSPVRISNLKVWIREVTDFEGSEGTLDTMFDYAAGVVEGALLRTALMDAFVVQVVFEML
jgi:hypothetical protein